MRKVKFIALSLALTMAMSTASAFACTGAYVGKDVSTNGTTMIARSEDQGSGCYNKRFLVKPRITKSGRYMVDEGEDQNGFKVPLPKTTYKYTYVPDSSDLEDGEYPASCTNEYGVAVVGTISASASSAYAKLDPRVETGTGLREAILPALIACQVKSAKGAVNKLAELLDKYGSEEGNILLFSDKKEAWIFEVYGGHGYAAMKMPSDKVAVFGNQFMIGKVDKNDTKNFVFSKGLFDILDKIEPVIEDGQYNLVKTISKTRSEGNNMRTWRGHAILSPSTIDTENYVNDEFYELLFTPDKKVSPLDVMDIYRDRYEGTQYDMTDPANVNRRAIGVTRQSDVHLVETYDQLPADTCQLQYLTMGCAEGGLFVPTFSGITDTYSAYHIDKNIYNSKSAYFNYRAVSALAQSDRANLMDGVKAFYKLEEEKMAKDINSEISKIKKAYAKSKTNGRKYVTELGKKTAKAELNSAKKLYTEVAKVQMYNVNDRTTRKAKFVADTKLTSAANFDGFKVTKKKVKKATTYTAKKGDKTVVYTLGNNVAKVNGKEVALTKAPYVSGGYVYVSMNDLPKAVEAPAAK